MSAASLKFDHFLKRTRSFYECETVKQNILTFYDKYIDMEA